MPWKRIVLSLLIVACLGCNTWERNTFNTLASSKAVLDTAQADYENHTIPPTKCAYTLINNGKAAQTIAVDAMVAYEQAKTTKGNLPAQEATVVGDLAALAPLVVQVQSLIGNPAAACPGGAS